MKAVATPFSPSIINTYYHTYLLLSAQEPHQSAVRYGIAAKVAGIHNAPDREELLRKNHQ